MNINLMYLSVYIIMLTEIVFFFAFIRTLQTAIKNEEECQRTPGGDSEGEEMSSPARNLFKNLLFVLIFYSSLVVFALAYMT